MEIIATKMYYYDNNGCAYDKLAFIVNWQILLLSLVTWKTGRQEDRKASNNTMIVMKSPEEIIFHG